MPAVTSRDELHFWRHHRFDQISIIYTQLLVKIAHLDDALLEVF